MANGPVRSVDYAFLGRSFGKRMDTLFLFLPFPTSQPSSLPNFLKVELVVIVLKIGLSKLFS